MTFFTLLAIFPAVAALVSCYGLVADASTINDQLASLQGILPQGALEIVGDQVKRLNEKGNTTLGFSLIVGIVLSVWSANGGMKHVFDALNLVYNEREKRNFVVLNLVSLAFTAGALLFLILALAAVVVLPVVLDYRRARHGCVVAGPAALAGAAAWRSCSGSPCSTATARAGTRRAGAGSRRGQRRRGRAVARRLAAVLLVRRQFRQATTRPTARSARPSAS